MYEGPTLALIKWNQIYDIKACRKISHGHKYQNAPSAAELLYVIMNDYRYFVYYQYVLPVQRVHPLHAVYRIMTVLKMQPPPLK